VTTLQTSRPLQIKTDQMDGVAVVSVSGYVDASNVQDFWRAIEPLCSGRGPKVVLDLQGLVYLNSIGFGLLLAWHRACRANHGKFALCGLGERTRFIMHLLGLETLLTICPTRDEAAAAMKNM